jgi:FecR protein
MLRYSKVLLISFTALSLVLAAPLSHGQDAVSGSHARIVNISYVEGTVQLDGERASMNSPIREGSRLVTGSDGVVEVRFEDGAAIRLASDTEMTFSQLARLSSGEAMTRVDLEAGEGEFLIPASSAGQFAVNVRSKNVLFAEPGRYRILSTNSSPLEVAVWKGEAGVRDRESGLAVRVEKNETFTLNPDDPGQYDLENALVADDLDEWSNQRDQYLNNTNANASANANANNSAYANTYTSGYASNGGGYYSQPYAYGFNGFGGCPYGFGGFNYWQPFWFGAGGAGCFNSGFFFGSPFFGSPFFGSPVVVVVNPPVLPRRPPIIHPPTPPVVAKGQPVPAPTQPGIRTFRFDGGAKRVFTDDNIQRTVPGVEGAALGEGVKPGGNSQETPQGTLIAPGQRSVARGPVAQTPASPAQPSPHTSAPPASHPSAPPQRSYSPPRSYSAPPSSSGSHGSSGGSMSHSSGSSSSGHHR